MFSIKNAAEIVLVSLVVHSDWLLLVDHPVVLVDDVLVEVFLTDLQVECNIPLHGDWVEVQVVTLLPVVE